MAGFAGGFNSPCVMTYMSEVARPQYRGIMMSFVALFLAGAQLILAIVNEIVAKQAPSHFRRVFYSEFFMLGLWLIPVIYVPESPGGSQITSHVTDPAI